MQVSAANRQSVESSSSSGSVRDEHLVKSGETLSGIAAERGVSVDALLRANPQIINPNLIRTGQVLSLPPRESAATYVVKVGDTLSAIGAKFGVSWQAIAQANGLTNPDLIRPEQQLTIPDGRAPSETAPSPTVDAAPVGETTAPTGALPSTTGLSQAQKFDLYAGYVNAHGDAQAKADLAAGKQVILGLRTDTSLGVNDGKGAYDDRIVVLQTNQSGGSVQEFSAATEPSSQYDGRYGGDADGDGRKELGRIAEGTVTFSKSHSDRLGDVLRPTEAHDIVRDTNHDGRIGAGDKTVKSTDGSFLFHAGGNGNTGSAGCQTMKPGDFQSFWNALGDQSRFHYVLVNVGTQGAPSPQAQTAPANSNQERIGGLSEHYESGGRGPGTVSSGAGDPGGVSYGTYQLAGNMNRPQQFLANEGSRWAAEFGGARPGTAAFSAAWREIAAREPEAFEAAQHDYIQRTHYQVQADQVRTQTGVDVTSRSAALRDVVWSTSVQHGPETQVIARAMANVSAQGVAPGDGQAYDRALINAIYDERGRRDASGGLAYFTSASASVQASVANRFADERRDALTMLNGN